MYKTSPNLPRDSGINYNGFDWRDGESDPKLSLGKWRVTTLFPTQGTIQTLEGLVMIYIQVVQAVHTKWSKS